MTSHDREFMNRVCTSIIEIDGGELITYSGNYDFYDQQKAMQMKQQQAAYERQQAMLAKELAFIERFKARASHAAQVQSRVKKLEKIDKLEPPRRVQKVAFEFKPPPRSGEDVLKLSKVRKAYGERVIFDGFDFLVRRRARGTREVLIAALRGLGATLLFVSRARHFLAALSNRVLELTPEGPVPYGGGYTEYVARTGREAPGLHPKSR